MDIKNLMLMERLVDAIQMRSMFDVFRFKHTIIANEIQEICTKIFKEINTKKNVWNIINTSSWYIATLNIMRNSVYNSQIIVEYNEGSQMIRFNGPVLLLNNPLLNKEGGKYLYCYQFTDMTSDEKEIFLRSVIDLNSVSQNT